MHFVQVQYIVHNVHCTMYTVHCIVYNVHCCMKTVKRVEFYNVQCIYQIYYVLPCIVQCTLYGVLLHCNHYSVYSVQCTVYTLHNSVIHQITSTFIYHNTTAIYYNISFDCKFQLFFLFLQLLFKIKLFINRTQCLVI